MELESSTYRIGQSKVFFRAGVLAHLEEERDAKLTDLIICFQSQCRAYLARRLYQKRVQQSNAIRILQRNGLAWLKLRNWQWWRLFTKVKPLLAVTNNEAAISQREEELRQLRERIQNNDQELTDTKQRLTQMAEERASLQIQLQTELEERSEAEDNADRTKTKFIELQETCNELQTRMEESDEHLTKLTDDKKKLEVIFHVIYDF